MQFQLIISFLIFFPFISKGQNETFYSYSFQLIEKPKKELENEARFRIDYYLKNTKSYNLNGNVRSMTESIHTKKGSNFDVISRSFTFNEKNNLVFLKLDSSDLTKNKFQLPFERYNYDVSGESLLKAEFQNNQFRWNNTKTIYFDSLGFLKEEQFKNRSPEIYNYDKNGINIFDYTLNYTWSKNKDSLRLNYSYLSNQTGYYRETDKAYFFGKRENSKKFFSFDEIGLSSKEIETDSNGNIVLMTNYDFTIKNSYNLHTRNFYTYNERNDLIEIRYESSIQDVDNFNCDEIVKIDYLEYDINGNWTLAKVTITAVSTFTDSYFFIPTEVVELFFRRQFKYFE